jgi:hypothetical protein
MPEKAATIHEIKKAISMQEPAEVLELCLRLAKYKKENKELLAYLLFEAHDEQAFVEKIKAGIDEEFDSMNKSTLYLAKKSIRKILRTTNKYIKYSGSNKTAAELLLYFCRAFRASGIAIRSSTALSNLYEAQLKKIGKTLEGMHEDLQYDYLRELEKLGYKTGAGD